jgi:APA family basic amino acid/polyamine antiporter
VNPQRRMGLGTGIGLVMANMIGAGVLLSAGFSVQQMSAGPLLWSWVLGMGLALCGAKAYGAVAASITRSGGEYRYLSSLFHPFLGSLAGWGSLLIGFSGPIAIDAIAVGHFANKLGVHIDPLAIGTGVIVALTLVHGLRFQTSTVTQNALVVVKVVLVLGLVTLGLTYGSLDWPTWQPPKADPDASILGLILENQFWIAFAFSGWNAVIYRSNEFEDPSQTVPKAMLRGCLIVGLLYLVVNFVFVANLTPTDAAVVFSYDEQYVTLAHALVERLVGVGPAAWMSGLVIVALTSAMSAMMMVGPGVYAEMANDGHLPAFLKSRDGRPPLTAMILQAAVAILFIYTHTILEVVRSSSSVLMLFTACTVAGLWVMRRRGQALSASSLAASAIYMALVSWILWHGLSMSGDIKTFGLFSLMLVLAGLSTIIARRNSGGSG